MDTLVLVHGGWSGKWVWDNNLEDLKKAGINALALDLPGHGENAPDKLKSVGLKDYVEYIEKEISGIDGKVVLCGHSLAGMIIAQVAEDMSDKVSALIFAAGFMPARDGQIMAEYIENDPWTQVSDKTMLVVDDPLLTFNPKYGRNMGFNMASDEQFFAIAPKIQLETPKMWYDPVHLTEKYHEVPKYYIHTLKDNCCSYYMQRILTHDEPVVKEYYLDADHCLMISRPHELSEVLVDIMR